MERVKIHWGGICCDLGESKASFGGDKPVVVVSNQANNNL